MLVKRQIAARLAAVGLCFSVGHSLKGAPGQARPLAPNEVWVNPGVGPGAPKDLAAFFAQTMVVFIGRLERISTEFLDVNQRELGTRLVFRPSEFIKGTGVAGETVEVWTPGGTYFDTPSGKTPSQPAEIASYLSIGSSYFVPVMSAAYPEGGPERYWLAALDAIARIHGRQVTPASPSSGWVNAVIKRGRSELPTGRGPMDDRAAFLAALKRVASQ